MFEKHVIVGELLGHWFIPQLNQFEKNFSVKNWTKSIRRVIVMNSGLWIQSSLICR